MTPNDIKQAVRDVLKEELGSYLSTDNQITLSKTIRLLGNNKLIANFYCGSVDNTGAASTPFPSGWTVSKTGTGEFTIVHNLNRTDYAVVAIASSATVVHCTVNTKTSTSFKVQCANTSHSASDQQIDFILML